MHDWVKNDGTLLRWDEMTDEQKRQCQDENAESAIFHEVGHAALDHSLQLWAGYAAELMASGTSREQAVRVCLEGFRLALRFHRAKAIYGAYRGFEYPGSRRVVSDRDAAKLAINDLQKEGSELDATVFDMFLDDLVPDEDE